MKKVIFLMSTVFAIGFTSGSLNAATLEVADDCEDIAFDYAEDAYAQTGDGFRAGRAFTIALALCELGIE